MFSLEHAARSSVKFALSIQTALGRDLLKCGIHIREEDPHVRPPLVVSVVIRKPSEQLVGVLELRELLELA